MKCDGHNLNRTQTFYSPFFRIGDRSNQGDGFKEYIPGMSALQDSPQAADQGLAPVEHCATKKTLWDVSFTLLLLINTSCFDKSGYTVSVAPSG